MTELFLKFNNSFVASTSDFWWDPNRQMSFGGSIANIMVNHYRFKNGLCLAMPDATMRMLASTAKTSDMLRGTTPVVKRCQALLDFYHFNKPKNGENIGAWLNDIHADVGCKPSYIGSHVVDGASNAGASVEELQWQTGGKRPQKIVAEKCDAHKASTTANQSSGTSSHVTNINPDMGMSLTKLHTWLGRFATSGARKKVLKNVRSEKGREKTVRIDQAVATRWKSRHTETVCANSNQLDLDTTIKRLVAPHGDDEKLYNENVNNLNAVMFTEDDWELYQQYESAMQPLNILITVCQTSQVFVHMELFECAMAREGLASPFFLMYNNPTVVPGAKDLTKRELSEVVTADTFVFNTDEYAEAYADKAEHTMRDEIVIARRAAWRLLGLRMGFVQRTDFIYRGESKKSSTAVRAIGMSFLFTMFLC